MMDSLNDESLPEPPEALAHGDVALKFIHRVPGNPVKGFAPSYHFRIRLRDGADAGHINFRVGDSEHVRLYAGHIGFEIAPPHRGHRYALQACLALAPFVRTIYESVTITCDPDNRASLSTIERLGAVFVEEVPIPPHDPHYQRGSRGKLRYRWTP